MSEVNWKKILNFLISATKKNVENKLKHDFVAGGGGGSNSDILSK